MVSTSEETQSIREWVVANRKDRTYQELFSLLQDNAQWTHVRVSDITKLFGVTAWLDRHMNRKDWIWCMQDFWFTHEEDAIMFKLTWSEKGAHVE